MFDTIAVARPYAKAIFSLSNEMDTHKEWDFYLNLITEVLINSYVHPIIKDPTIDENKKLSFLLKVCDIYLDEYSRNFIIILSKFSRLAFVPEIYAIYKQYLNIFNGVVVVNIVTSSTMSVYNKESLQDFVFQKFGVKAKIKYEIDPCVVGGVMFKTENKIIDATFRGNLERLHEFFNKI